MWLISKELLRIKNETISENLNCLVSVPRGIRTPIGGTGNHNSIH